ncbi:MAG: PAS domain-containing protein [Proteobacteria bacterium]|nr:PAS domain-containing protein [Pseudomonadota bacterium]
MDDPAGPESKPRRPVDRVAVSLAIALVALVVAALYFTPKFIDDERQREMRAWQIRLGIIADSRVAAVNEWADRNFAALRELTENASLQLYMTELTLGEGDKARVTDEAAEAGYLRNLLTATANRAGFTPPQAGWDVRANVERVGVAGIGLFDADGRSIVATPGMPPLAGRIRDAVAKALGGEPALIDIYTGASNLPTMGFVLPVFAVQGETAGARGIGVVVGIRVIGRDLFERLAQPGEIATTAETYLVRSAGAVVDYLSPLADGTPPLKRSLALDTADLAAAYALEKPGGFAIRIDYAGDEVLVASRSLASLPWILVRTVSLAEALGETELRLRTMLGVFVLVIVAVTVTIIAVWRHGTVLRERESTERFRTTAERFETLSTFLRVVTDSQPTVIAAVDGDARYTFANEPAAKEAGIAMEDMLGKPLADVIGPVKAKALTEVNRRVLATAERESHTHWFGVDDEERVIKSEHIPLPGTRDHPPGVLMVLDDITELTHARQRGEQRLRQLIGTLTSVVDRRDPFSAHHSVRVAEVARCIAGEMGVPDGEAQTAEIAGTLMNIGKIFIPPEVLTKTGELTDEERTLVANSTMVSVDLLDGVDFEGPVVETIRQMRETWDGTGPLGKKEEETLRTARILAVANAFVGMTSPRAYREALTFEDASAILLERSGATYDRKPISALLNYLENRGGTEKWASFRDTPA